MRVEYLSLRYKKWHDHPIKKLFREQFLFGLVAEWIRCSSLMLGPGVRVPLGQFFIFFFYNFRALHHVRRIITVHFILLWKGLFLSPNRPFTVLQVLYCNQGKWTPVKAYANFLNFQNPLRFSQWLAGSARQRGAGLLLSAWRQRIMLF